MMTSQFRKFLLLSVMILVVLFARAQHFSASEQDSLTHRKIISVTKWLPLNAYSIAPGAESDSVLISAMPVNLAYGVSVGNPEDKFVRLSAIANWRIEYEVRVERESFSLDKIGIGLMVDYSEFFYVGVVYPLEIMSMRANQPQILLGMQIALMAN